MPKVFILENVKGIIQGNAKVYSKKIVEKMELGGYKVQVFCLNGAFMGVPQTRERVFFIGHKKELMFDRLNMKFNEKPILFKEIKEFNCQKKECINFPQSEQLRLQYVKYGDRDLSNADNRLRNKNKAFFNHKLIYDNKVCGTITAQEKQFVFNEKRRLSDYECCLAGTWPLDYDFKNVKPKYLIGMSVPPVMTAQIANQIYKQWLSKV